MCGIFGFNFSDKKLAKSIVKILNHRGPDDNSIYEDELFTIGYTRLSIIDLDKGNQPIYNAKKTKLVFFNGEIYNYKELRTRLEKKGYKFKTNSDTEIVIHSYEEYGKKCLNYFNGMFALIIYDLEKKEIFIARDRLGIKPLYYSFDDNRFLFSSEMKASFLFEDLKKELNHNSINNYFTFRYCPGESTFIKGIKKLLPAHYLVFKDNKLVTRKYWNLEFSEQSKSLAYFTNKFQKLFEDSVKKRMIADVPIGALLSGGIDSSSIVAMMSKNSDSNIKTFTMGFDEGFNNEFKAAKLVSDKFGTEHEEYIIDSSYIKYLPKLVWHLDEPVADPTAIPNYVLAKNASKKVKVLLNGDGADEVFAGYEQYKLYKILRQYNKLPLILRKTVNGAITPLTKEPFFIKLKSFLTTRKDYLPKSFLELTSVFGEEEKQKLFSNNFKKSLTRQENPLKQYLSIKNNFVNKLLYSDINTYLPNNMLLKYDKITMAKSVEGRVPFCDHRLVEFSATIPVNYKLKGFNEKYIIRKAMVGTLPRSIIKKKKQRFLVPTDNWLKRDFGDYANQVLDDNQKVISNFFDKSYLKKLYQDKKPFSQRILSINPLTRLYYSRQIWTVTNFLIWHNTFIENKKI